MPCVGGYDTGTDRLARARVKQYVSGPVCSGQRNRVVAAAPPRGGRERGGHYINDNPVLIPGRIPSAVRPFLTAFRKSSQDGFSRYTQSPPLPHTRVENK